MPLRRVMMVAGEASGDLHGAGVVRELRRRVPEVQIFGIGGDAMEREGMECLVHIRELSFMGLLEVIKNLGTVRRVEKAMRVVLEQRRPDVAVLIDYPGFNLRFARDVKKCGIPVLYYISPQVWAWHKSRVHTMRRLVDKMKVVFPFEVPLYQSAGVDVEFVGHPVAERIGSRIERGAFFAAHGLQPEKKLLALLPGSRVQELEKILPVMATAGERLQRELGVQVALGVAPNLGPDLVRSYLPADAHPLLVEHATYDLMCHADAVIVTSGTATLETGWFATPMVVVYKTSPLTYHVGRLLVDIKNIALANIVAGKSVVPELIQHQLTVGRLVDAARRLLTDQQYATTMRQELSVIKNKLGGPGASARVAEGIIALAEAA
jgi:lipid-A-disaccharide synthase